MILKMFLVNGLVGDKLSSIRARSRLELSAAAKSIGIPTLTLLTCELGLKSLPLCVIYKFKNLPGFTLDDELFFCTIGQRIAKEYAESSILSVLAGGMWRVSRLLIQCLIEGLLTPVED